METLCLLGYRMFDFVLIVRQMKQIGCCFLGTLAAAAKFATWLEQATDHINHVCVYVCNAVVECKEMESKLILR